MAKGCKGFTLIELLIVVAIMGILAAIGLPMYQGFIEESRCAATRSQLDRVRSKVQAELVRCITHGQYTAKSSNGLLSYRCRSDWDDYEYFARMMAEHFRWSDWKNPHGVVTLKNGIETDIGVIGLASRSPYVVDKSYPAGVIWMTGSNDRKQVFISTNSCEKEPVAQAVVNFE